MAAAVFVPLGALLGLELMLRLAGYGYATDFFVRHPAAGSAALVENQRFPWRFFPRALARRPDPVVISPDKGADTFRIFVLGESAAEGDPAPAFGFSRILGVLLKARYPNVKPEVVNVAFTAINSHVILPIARDCRHLQGDAWLVYMGHNEVIGPFGTGTIFSPQSPPLALIRAGLALKNSRVGQLLDATFQSLAGSKQPTNGWAGMDMFLAQQIRADDPRLQRLEQQFERNLSEIIRLGTSGGAQVIVSTTASRVRDWPPFGSLHRANLTPDEQARWNAAFEAGVKAESEGDAARAVRWFKEAALIDEEYAELQYRWGRTCLALGQHVEARTRLERARDLDSLRFRTDSRLNEAIRRTVAAEAARTDRVRLLDAEAGLASRSEHGLPGEEWFHEHVHFTFAGNYQLARLFAEELAPRIAFLQQGQNPEGPTTWLAESECAARLGYTDNQRYEIGTFIRRRFGEAIYRGQPGHARRVEALQQQLSGLRLQTKPTARRQALEVCRAAAAANPDDWVLHDLMARLLVALDDPEGAAAEWQHVNRLIPHWAPAYTELGKLAQAHGDFASAQALFARASEVNPDHAAAYTGLGAIRGQQGRADEALRFFRKALRLDPASQEARDGLSRLSAAPLPGR